MPDDALLRCRLCGASPAVNVKVHEHHGMIILMQHLTYRGPLCRDCGMKVVKRCTRRTLVMGWWGVVSLFLGTPITLLLDLVAWLRIRGLSAPVTVTPVSEAVAPGVPTAAGPAAAPALLSTEQSPGAAEAAGS